MPPTIIVGHYGSGKTEFAANYAQGLLDAGGCPKIADLDIVNPYFRLREKKEYYAAKGADVVSSTFEAEPHIDTPGLAAGLRACFETEGDSVIDVGGDAVGATVLARYAHHLKNRPYEMWMAVNANRPLSDTPKKVLAYMAEIEGAGRLHITGLLNTTHMLRETAAADVQKGDTLVREVAEQSGLPVVYTVFLRELAPVLETLDLAGERFPIVLHMRPKWL